jgi:cob(I)alamin adenosyltransferase
MSPVVPIQQEEVCPLPVEREQIYPKPEIIEPVDEITPLARLMLSHQEGVQTGLIHIYTGDGKGKTTSAVGLTIRAYAHGLRIMFVQFLKNGLSGEIGILRQLNNVRFYSGKADLKFSNQMYDNDRNKTREMHQHFLEIAMDAANSCEIDLLVMDETFGALSTGLLDSDQVYEFVKNKPADLELVMTGRNPEQRFIELADYVSNIQCLAHPYMKNILAREGIDY